MLLTCNRVAGKLLLEAAAAAHDRADRAQRLCRQLRAKSEGNTSGSGGGGGGGLLAGVLDRERQRTVRLLLMHRRDDDDDDDNEFGRADGENDRNRNGGAEKSCWDCRDCWSDDDGDVDAAAVDDFCSGDQEEFTAAGIAGVPGLDIDRGVLIRRKYLRPTLYAAYINNLVDSWTGFLNGAVEGG